MLKFLLINLQIVMGNPLWSFISCLLATQCFLLSEISFSIFPEPDISLSYIFKLIQLSKDYRNLFRLDRSECDIEDGPECLHLFKDSERRSNEADIFLESKVIIKMFLKTQESLEEGLMLFGKIAMSFENMVVRSKIGFNEFNWQYDKIEDDLRMLHLILNDSAFEKSRLPNFDLSSDDDTEFLERMAFIEENEIVPDYDFISTNLDSEGAINLATPIKLDAMFIKNLGVGVQTKKVTQLLQGKITGSFDIEFVDDRWRFFIVPHPDYFDRLELPRGVGVQIFIFFAPSHLIS